MIRFLRSKPQTSFQERRRQTDGRHLMLFGVFYLVLLAAVAVLVAVSIRPREIAAPGQSANAGKVVLTVEGHGRRTTFDMSTLQALPQHIHKVSTPWYLRPVSFQGPLLRDVLATADVSGTRIAAVAVNDFTADIPFEHTEKYDVIVALRMDGRPLPARDKGPLFVIYPYDNLPQKEREKSFGLSVWQLDVLRVE